ncbi:MAG: aminotransferase class I/II-fold pyridoxal phosphate-dependent enzyme [Woeseia sp.]
MAHVHEINRRAFLKGASLTALAGVGGSAAFAQAAPLTKKPDGRYDFDEVYPRVGTDCYKWDKQIELFSEDQIVVPMGIADMDFRTAPVITAALVARLQHENWGYMHVPPSFRQSMIDWNRRRYGEEIDPKSLLTASGVNPAILSGLRAFAPPGSKVLLLAPTYSAFYSTITTAHCVPEESPMKLARGRYTIDFEDLERRIDHDTNVLILCNPQNPTGNCWSRDDLLTLGEICERRRVVVFADEIHCDFVNKGQRYTPFSELNNEAVVRNSITFKSTSKSFNLAATKCAYMYSRNLDYIARIKDTGHNQIVNTLGVIASEVAYNDAEDWLDQVVEYIDGNMDFAAAYIAKNVAHVKFEKPEGTYLAWLDVNELAEKIDAEGQAVAANRGRDPALPALQPEHMVERFLVREAGVQLNDGFRYGAGGAGRMRMNLATSRVLVEKALASIASATRNA